MSTKTQATIEDLYHVPDNGKAEIVDGELRLMSPTGDLHGSATLEIAAALTRDGLEWGAPTATMFGSLWIFPIVNHSARMPPTISAGDSARNFLKALRRLRSK